MNDLKNLYLAFQSFSDFNQNKELFFAMMIVLCTEIIGIIIAKLTTNNYRDLLSKTMGVIFIIISLLGLMLVLFTPNLAKQNGSAVKTTETSNGLKGIPIPAKVEHLESNNILSKNPRTSRSELVIRFDNGQKLILSNSELNGSNTSDKYPVYYGSAKKYPRSKFESSNKYVNVKAIQLGKNTNWDDLKPGTKLKISRLKYEPANWVSNSNKKAMQSQLKKDNSDNNMTLVVTKKD